MCNCMFCGHNSKFNSISYFTTYNCDVCGIYTVDNNFISDKFLRYFNTPEESLKRNEFVTNYSTYLFYNRKNFADYKNQNRFMIGTVDSVKVLNNIMGEDVSYNLLTDDIVCNFYPSTLKKLTEKVLSKIYSDRDLSNNTAIYSEQEAESLFCIFRDYINPKLIIPSKDAYDQINEFLGNLKNKKLIECSDSIYPYSERISIKLTIKGREFVENFTQKNDINTSGLDLSNFPNKINNTGNLANNSNIKNSVFGNNNDVIIVETSKQSCTPQDQHDIEALERLLSSIPKTIKRNLEHRLLENRQYKYHEFDYIFDFEELVNDNDNYLINEELRNLCNIMSQAFIKLSSKISSRFGLSRNDSNYFVLDRPLLNDEYQKQYYDYLTKELPVAIQNAVDAYNNLCHKRTELFGI